MLHLGNDSLTLDIVDPHEDADRLGPRFCSGGYVYQVHHRTRGELLAGPEFPAALPSAINGQGMPEVFQHTLFADPAAVPGAKLIIGVGSVENSARGTNIDLHFGCRVAVPCVWTIRENAARLHFTTDQQQDVWSVHLEKSIRLEGTTVTSGTRLLNTGTRALPFRWFAHPFFPLRTDGACFALPPAWGMEENEGFIAAEGRMVHRRPGTAWHRGHFQVLRVPADTGLECQCAHPSAGSVLMQGSFPLARVAIWGNDRTFSLEPFHAASLDTGAAVVWEIRYTFL